MAAVRARVPFVIEREIDLRGVSFDQFLAHAFDRSGPEWQVKESEDTTLLEVDAALQIQHAERLFRDPSCVARFSRDQRVQGFWFLPNWFQPDFFSWQIWNHDLPISPRISCVNAMSVLYRDLFAHDDHDDRGYMWFDLLEGAAPGRAGDSAAGTFCSLCMPVRNALIGVLQEILAIAGCERAALHGLNHWGTAADRAAIIDPWLRSAPPGKMRDYALLCRDGKAE